MTPASEPSPGLLELAPGVLLPQNAIHWQYARSSGPGGQNVNKLNTKSELWLPVTQIPISHAAQIRLRHLAGSRLTKLDEIHVSSESERTQEGNRTEAINRLRDLIVRALHVPKHRKKMRISKGAKRRRLESKRKRSDVKSNRTYRPEL